jgi:hypothetical protein
MGTIKFPLDKAKEISELVSRARRSLKLTGDGQQMLLRRARASLKATNAQLAEALGVKLPTIKGYLAPDSAGKHRPLPDSLRSILEWILNDTKRRR